MEKQIESFLEFIQNYLIIHYNHIEETFCNMKNMLKKIT